MSVKCGRCGAECKSFATGRELCLLCGEAGTDVHHRHVRNSRREGTL
jgi:hypothetical protein